MQQRMAPLDAECPNDEIDRPPNRKSAAAQVSIVCRGLHGQSRIKQSHDFKLAQCLLNQLCFSIGAQPLQDLAEDQIADKQFLPRDERAQL
jgi:hypothetical protein